MQIHCNGNIYRCPLKRVLDKNCLLLNWATAVYRNVAAKITVSTEGELLLEIRSSALTSAGCQENKPNPSKGGR